MHAACCYLVDVHWGMHGCPQAQRSCGNKTLQPAATMPLVTQMLMCTVLARCTWAAQVVMVAVPARLPPMLLGESNSDEKECVGGQAT